MLSEESGFSDGWRCCWGAPNLPQLPSATPKNPPPSIVVFCFIGKQPEVGLILSEKLRGKSHFGLILVSAVSGIWNV